MKVTPNPVLRTNIPRVGEMQQWLVNSSSGDQLVYHWGHLARDRCYIQWKDGHPEYIRVPIYADRADLMLRAERRREVRLPRMADFAVLGMAVAPALGWSENAADGADCDGNDGRDGGVALV